MRKRMKSILSLTLASLMLINPVKGMGSIESYADVSFEIVDRKPQGELEGYDYTENTWLGYYYNSSSFNVSVK